MSETTLILPWPDSVNIHWEPAIIRRRPAMRISAKGRAYRKSVVQAMIFQGVPTFCEPLEARLDYHPPTNADRDLDNFEKSLWDALEHARVIENDTLVKRVEKQFQAKHTPGIVVVRLRPYTGTPAPFEGSVPWEAA